VRGYGFSAADGVDAFIGFSFQVNCFGRDAKGFCEGFAHFRKMRAELWFFHDHNGVYVLDRQTFFVEKLASVFEKHQAVRAFPFGIGVWEMSSDIAECRCAQQRVAHGVGENIAVGVPDRSFVERERDAADDERAALRQAVQVVADAATNFTHIWHSCLVSLSALQAEIEAGQFHIGRLGNFDVALGAVHDVNIVTQPFDEAGFVGSVDAVGGRPGKSLFQ
jgi:hypothetical protein